MLHRECFHNRLCGKASDLDDRPDLIHIADSQDVATILQSIGHPLTDETMSLFASVGDGDYTEVWACSTIVPWNGSYVWRIYGGI
jgi:hypothetical protein